MGYGRGGATGCDAAGSRSECLEEWRSIQAGIRSGPSFTAVRGAGYVAWYPITTESADFSEGNSLFEVADRWKAREAGSEFRAKFEVAGNEESQTVLCGGGARAGIQPAEIKYVPATCHEERLGTVAPTFVAGRYVTLSKPPLSLYAFAGHESGATTYSYALEPAMKFVTGWFGPPDAPDRSRGSR